MVSTRYPFRFAVGTLYSNENAVDLCKLSVELQTIKSNRHFLIEGFAKREAHHQLFNHWMSTSDDYDYAIKLDADMQLAHPEMLSRLNRYLRKHPHLQIISIPVWDYFTDRLIHGLNVYQSGIRWSLNDDHVFTDRQCHNASCVRIGIRQLAPAAFHGFYPSSLQSFRYGAQRGLKALTSYQSSAKHGDAGVYLQNIADLRKQYHRHTDHDRRLALLAAELALAGELTESDLNVNSRNAAHWVEVADREPTNIDSEIRTLSKRSIISPTERAELAKPIQSLLLPRVSAWMRFRYPRKWFLRASNPL